MLILGRSEAFVSRLSIFHHFLQMRQRKKITTISDQYINTSNGILVGYVLFPIRFKLYVTNVTPAMCCCKVPSGMYS